MNKEERLLQQELIREIHEASKQYPKVIMYMETIMKHYDKLEKALLDIKEYIEKCNFDNAEILYDFGSEYCYIDDFKEHTLDIVNKALGDK